MRNKPRNKPVARYTETIVDGPEGQFDVCHLDIWDNGPSLVVRLFNNERRAMVQTFRTAVPDIDVTMKHVLKCIEFGRATDQRTRYKQGIEIDVELKREDGGIFILMHLTTLYNDDGSPRHVVPLRDKDGKYVMEGDAQVMVAAALTFERFFPENRVARLQDVAEDLVLAMQLRRIRRKLRAKGDQKTLREQTRSLDYFLEEAEKAPPVERLAVSVADRTQDRQPKQGKKAKVVLSTETKTEAPAQPTPAETVEPVGDETSFANLVTPVPVAATPAPAAPKPPKLEKQKIKLGTPEGNAKLAELGAATDGSNGQNS